MEPLEARDIQKIIPHRYPMLLIDRVIELEPPNAPSRSRTSPATSGSSRAISPSNRSCPAC